LYNDKSIEAGISKAQDIIIRWIERKF